MPNPPRDRPSAWPVCPLLCLPPRHAPDHGRNEHPNQMRGTTEACQHGEEAFENACLAKPVEAFPDAVPVSIAFGQRPPGDGVNRDVVQRFQAQPVVFGLRPSCRRHARNTSRAKSQSASFILVDITDPPFQSAIHQSDTCCAVTRPTTT